MGTEDYTTATSGSLKLKGVKGSRVEKQKKKKKRVKDEQPTNPSKEIKREADAEEGKETEVGNGREVALRKALDEELDDPQDKEQFQGVGKTEAERRHEERRRKRVSFTPNYHRKNRILMLSLR